MNRIAVITDSNSGITQKKAADMGIHVLPMPFYIDGELYYEDLSLTQERFYQFLEEGAEVSTSQPAPGDVMKLWDEVLKDHSEIIYIPMSSGLSGSCEMAVGLSRDYGGRVHVIDNKRISVTQKQSVLDALKMADRGMSAGEISEALMKDSMNARIYIMVDTLKYLKNGGRVTAAGAALGTVLNIKPVLKIEGEKLDAFAKARGFKAARRMMLDKMSMDIKEFFSGEKVNLFAVYSGDDREARDWFYEIQDNFREYRVGMERLSLSISCHIGPGALAIACAKELSAGL